MTNARFCKADRNQCHALNFPNVDKNKENHHPSPLLSWEERIAERNHGGPRVLPRALSVLESRYLWWKILFTLRVTLVAMFPISILLLAPETNHIFANPYLAITLSMLSARPTVGGTMMFLVEILKACAVTIPLMTVYTAIHVYVNAYSWSVVYLATLIGLGYLFEGFTKKFMFIITHAVMLGMLRSYWDKQGKATTLAFPIHLAGDFMLATGFALASCLIPFPKFAFRRADAKLETASRAIALCFHGLCDAFWSDSNLERRLKLVHIRHSHQLAVSSLEDARPSIGECRLELQPLSRYYLRIAKFQLLSSFIPLVDCALKAVETITEDPAIIHGSTRAAEYGKRLGGCLRELAAAYEESLMLISSATSTKELFYQQQQQQQQKQIGHHDKHQSDGASCDDHHHEEQQQHPFLRLRSALNTFERNFALARRDLEYPQRAKTSRDQNSILAQQDLVTLASFYVFTLSRFIHKVLKFPLLAELQQKGRSFRVAVMEEVLTFVMAPVMNIKAITAFCMPRGWLPSVTPEARLVALMKLKETVKFAAAMGLANLFNYYTDRPHAFWYGPMTLCFIASLTSSEAVSGSIERLFGTLFGGILGLFFSHYVTTIVQRVAVLAAVNLVFGFFRTGKQHGGAATYASVQFIPMVAVPTTTDGGVTRISQIIFGILMYTVISIIVFPTQPLAELERARAQSLLWMGKVFEAMTTAFSTATASRNAPLSPTAHDSSAAAAPHLSRQQSSAVLVPSSSAFDGAAEANKDGEEYPQYCPPPTGGDGIGLFSTLTNEPFGNDEGVITSNKNNNDNDSDSDSASSSSSDLPFEREEEEEEEEKAGTAGTKQARTNRVSGARNRRRSNLRPIITSDKGEKPHPTTDLLLRQRTNVSMPSATPRQATTGIEITIPASDGIGAAPQPVAEPPTSPMPLQLPTPAVETSAAKNRIHHHHHHKNNNKNAPNRPLQLKQQQQQRAAPKEENPLLADASNRLKAFEGIVAKMGAWMPLAETEPIVSRRAFPTDASHAYHRSMVNMLALLDLMGEALHTLRSPESFTTDQPPLNPYPNNGGSSSSETHKEEGSGHQGGGQRQPSPSRIDHNRQSQPNHHHHHRHHSRYLLALLDDLAPLAIDCGERFSVVVLMIADSMLDIKHSPSPPQADVVSGDVDTSQAGDGEEAMKKVADTTEQEEKEEDKEPSFPLPLLNNEQRVAREYMAQTRNLMAAALAFEEACLALHAHKAAGIHQLLALSQCVVGLKRKRQKEEMGDTAVELHRQHGSNDNEENWRRSILHPQHHDYHQQAGDDRPRKPIIEWSVEDIERIALGMLAEVDAAHRQRRNAAGEVMYEGGCGSIALSPSSSSFAFPRPTTSSFSPSSDILTHDSRLKMLISNSDAEGLHTFVYCLVLLSKELKGLLVSARAVKQHDRMLYT